MAGWFPLRVLHRYQGTCQQEKGAKKTQKRRDFRSFFKPLRGIKRGILQPWREIALPWRRKRRLHAKCNVPP
jgi:hypothetical protein